MKGNEFVKGMKHGLGILFIFCLFYSVSASGFHIADEVLDGTFDGNFIFKGSVNFAGASVSGLNVETIPSGFIGAFYLSSCPSGWKPANGASGTPDLRGVFVRGLDSGRGVDSGRGLGTYQADLFKSHYHITPANGHVKYSYNGKTSVAAVGTAIRGANYESSGWDYPSRNSGGAETRPKNVALLYCMKS